MQLVNSVDNDRKALDKQKQTLLKESRKNEIEMKVLCVGAIVL